jgi:N-hydroxyarylamine O-acetyltransferase
MPIEVDAYLQRVAYAGPREPTTDVLRALQRAHLLAVPFENLDINPGGIPISLEIDAIFDKVVRRRRGGFCYELNGLFAVLLGQLGFNVTLVSARVARDGGEFGPDFDHLALVVHGEQPYLADVGFGDFSLEPLELGRDGPQPPSAGGRAYRVDPLGNGKWLTRVPTDAGEWEDGYLFDLTPRALADFEPQCRWFESAEESNFRSRRTISIATPDGRVTLRDADVIVTRDGVKQVAPLDGEREWRAALLEWFGISLTTDSPAARS